MIELRPDSLPRWSGEWDYVSARFGKVYHHEGDDEQSWTEMAKLAADEYYSPEIERGHTQCTGVAQAKGVKGLQIYAAACGPSFEAADVPQGDNSISYPLCFLSFWSIQRPAARMAGGDWLENVNACLPGDIRSG